MTLELGLIGHPVAHSRSPEIHRAFGAQFDLDVAYRLYDTPPEELRARLQDLADRGVQGLNVTVPFKEEVFRIISQSAGRARLAGAVNTLIPEDGSWSADNTDGAGFMADIEGFRGFACRGARILLLGAGGAVRGVLAPLIAAGPAHIHIANRSPENAHRLVRDFADQAPQAGTRLSASAYADCPDLPADVIVNGTSASLTDQLLPLADSLCRRTRLAYDMMYASKPTVFMDWADRQGVPETADGLGMLVGQAAESFRLWTGRQPDIGPVMTQLRAGQSDPRD